MRLATEKTMSKLVAWMVAGLACLGLSFALTPTHALAVQAEGDSLAAGSIAEKAVRLDAQASKASKVKAARKAYKSYLAKHPSYEHFKVVQMGNGGVPVLLCTKQKPFQSMDSDFWITTDVFVYDKSKKAKVKNLGTLSTGGTAFQLNYAKGSVYGHRVAGMHTFGVATVKNGRLSLSGMFDDQYGENLRWRHFSGYNPKSKTPLWESKALGKSGTEAQYRKLVGKYGSHPLKMYANTAANRSKRI